MLTFNPHTVLGQLEHFSNGKGADEIPNTVEKIWNNGSHDGQYTVMVFLPVGFATVNEATKLVELRMGAATEGEDEAIGFTTVAMTIPELLHAYQALMQEAYKVMKNDQERATTRALMDNSMIAAQKLVDSMDADALAVHAGAEATHHTLSFNKDEFVEDMTKKFESVHFQQKVGSQIEEILAK